MTVRFNARALRQLKSIHAYIAEDNHRAAAEVIARIEELCFGLDQFPDMGYATDRRDIRVLVVGRYPYKIYYRTVQKTSATDIQILAIRHSAMDDRR
jgi:plasmid stabilization system protein ParE